MDTVCKFIEKLKLELSFDPAILLMAVYSEKIKKKTLAQTNINIPVFIAEVFM